MFPGMMPKKIKEKMNSNVGKGHFELNFNETEYLKQPFTVRVLYDSLKDIPVKMAFIKFEKKKDHRKARLCLHSCVQNKQIRYFIKYVPEGVKPFSLKITVCPNCGTPLAYRFIVYPGDLKMYPKIKDMNKYKSKGKIQTGQEGKAPKALVCPEYRIGV